ncbi:MAG: MarR family transcriptional regulator [Euryarchaeota archaeon]|nr:MarR family transcriptional regulator [Euryarchaeota archaeon]
MGEEAQFRLLGFLEDNQGLNTYQIAKKLGWSGGKVRYTLKKLEENGLVRVEEAAEGGRKINKVFLVNWKDMLNWELVRKDMEEMKLSGTSKEKIKIVS